MVKRRTSNLCCFHPVSSVLSSSAEVPLRGNNFLIGAGGNITAADQRVLCDQRMRSTRRPLIAPALS